MEVNDRMDEMVMGSDQGEGRIEDKGTLSAGMRSSFCVVLDGC